MKKLLSVLLVLLVYCGLLFAVGGKDASNVSKWPQEPVTVICPWAVGGVADLVNRKAATFGQQYLGQPVLATNVLGAGGNVALTNYLSNKANSYNLIFGAEGAFSIAPNVDDSIVFKYSDYIPIINMYSAVFVMTADSKLGIKDLDALKAYGRDKKIKVAVNGLAGSEYFLGSALFKELGLQFEAVSYNGANLALEAAVKGEVQFVISHQSQAKASVQSGLLVPVVAFDKIGLNNDVYKVKGVGDYGYKAYFRNRCFLLARAGTDQEIIDKIRDTYLKILERTEMKDVFTTLMIEYDPLTPVEINEHIKTVDTIVKANIAK